MDSVGKCKTLEIYYNFWSQHAGEWRSSTSYTYVSKKIFNNVHPQRLLKKFVCHGIEEKGET